MGAWIRGGEQLTFMLFDKFRTKPNFSSGLGLTYFEAKALYFVHHFVQDGRIGEIMGA